MALAKVAPQYRQELCRIIQQGLAQAAEMLSRLLRQPVSVEVADAWMSDQVLPARLATESCLGVYMEISGDIQGGLLLTFSEDCADWLSRKLLGVAELEDLLQEPASSTLKEVGNILASSFLATLDNQLGLRALPAPPVLIRASLAELQKHSQPKLGEACLVARTRFKAEGAGADNLQGAIYLFPEPAALEQLLAKISQA